MVLHKPPLFEDSDLLPVPTNENIWKKFKRKFMAKNKITVRKNYENYYGRKFSVDTVSGVINVADIHRSPMRVKLDRNTLKELDNSVKHNHHADAVLANWTS